MLLNNNSLIMQWNRDENGNPISWHIPSETQQISPNHGVVQLVQVPDQHYRMKIVTENNVLLTEVFNVSDIEENSYYVDYGVGIVRFHPKQFGKMVMISYYGRGVVLISDSRIFHRDGENVADTWDNILARSQDALDLIESAGGLVEAMEQIDEKITQGEATADRLENFITETQFYGYTITLSREAFVVKAKEDGEVSKTEIQTIYTDVVVYQGAKQIVPTLSIEQEQGCAFKVEGQRVKLTSIDLNVIKANATLNIDCGEGLIAKRTLEVTKVFDGVSQYAVEMTNPFYSFEADSTGNIEEEVTVACDIKVTKANVDYTHYTISVQNAPRGLRYNVGATGVEFTSAIGGALPSNGSCLVVVTIDGASFNKTFTWNKVRRGEDAKSLVLIGGQIVRYETPDYSDVPSPYRSTVTAKTVGLSGSPKWYVKNNDAWELLEGQSGTELTFLHNDIFIWGNRKETTVKCVLEDYEDELTLVKLATGTTGADAITVILTNESHTLAIDNSGYVHESEIAKTTTSVLAFQGTQEVTPVLSKGVCEGCDITINENLVTLASLDNSFTTATAVINVEVNGIVIPKTWTISKAKQGSDGATGEDGKSYILNITDGTRSFTYSQINLDPRPATSATFVGTLYENGAEVLDGVSYYWVANGHIQGSSINRTFTPTISKTFDESILNNDVQLTVTYNGNTMVQTVPISITKDANGLDWVQEWDDTKTDVRGNVILTPKLFAGSYDQENDLVTGVAIGKDVLNDGNTVGVAGYQNNKTTFLLDTDGTLMVGNPFEDNSTGMYFDGEQFTLKVSQLTIEGTNVATTDDLTTKVDEEINSVKEELRAEVSDVISQVNELDTFMNNALKDGILDEVERSRLTVLYETLTSEMMDVVSQYMSIINSPYLTNETVLNVMEENFNRYVECYQKLTDILNTILGTSNVGDEGVVEPEPSTRETVEGGNTEGDFITEEEANAFGNAVADFREASALLHQSMNDALTSISETQANIIIAQAKQEIELEINGVSDALDSLEQTMNGEFKSGLISTMNLTTLRSKLSQLETEKADIDGQYDGLINNPKLGATSRTNLANAKSELDTAHDQLVAKINSAVSDNLMTEKELEEINRLISLYAQTLKAYSEIAQQANADIALNLAQGAIAALNQEDIFNKLTNNGETQGIYLKDGKVYINGEYINSRNLKAVRNDGTETFKIDSEGNVHIRANSFYLVGDSTDSNVASKDYVDDAVGGVSLGSINIMLSNEAQVIATSSNRVPFSNQTFSTKIEVYKGSTQIHDFTIGNISNANGITVSIDQNTKTVNFSVSSDAAIAKDNGSFMIPISVNGNTYSKRWTWAVSKQGDTGATGGDGQDAQYVILNGDQIFKYSNNFTGAPTPENIKIQATAYGTSNPKYTWEFKRGGETTWNTITSATNNNQNYYTLPHDNSTIFNNPSVKSVTIRCTVNGRSDEITVVKVSDGAKGDIGDSAKTVSLTSSSQVFKSTDGGLTFTPDDIVITPNFQNVTYSKWQYSTNGGSSWTDVGSSTNGVTYNSTSLTLSKSSTLLTDKVTSVAFKIVTNDSSIYDTITIVKLYDVTDLSLTASNRVKGSIKPSETWTVTSGSNKSWSPYVIYGDVRNQKVIIAFDYVAKNITKDSGAKAQFQSHYYKSDDTDTWTPSFALDLPVGDSEGTIVSPSLSFGDVKANTTPSFRFRFDNIGGQFSISKARVYVGTKDVGWLPAPEDVNEQLTSIETDLQTQIDGKIDTWSQETPDPASSWTTSDEKAKHKGDIWYKPTSKETYRYTGTAWERLYDQIAENATNIANQKRRVFVSTPTTPYDVGDLWINNEELYRCKTALSSGNYNSGHWVKAVKYTDDSVAQSAKNDLQAFKNLDEWLVINNELDTYFPFDNNLQTTGGVNPNSGYNAYLTPQGKFGNCLSVQEDVVNLFAFNNISELNVYGGGTLTTTKISHEEVVCRYEPSSSTAGVYRGKDITVDTQRTYTLSGWMYVSENYNSTVAPAIKGEQGFSKTMNYDMNKKGQWQFFSHTMKPSSEKARILLYPRTSSSVANATTGYILYKNVQFTQTGAVHMFYNGTKPKDTISYEVSQPDVSTMMAYKKHVLDSDFKHQALVKNGSTFTFYENGVATTNYVNKWRVYACEGITTTSTDGKTIDKYNKPLSMQLTPDLTGIHHSWQATGYGYMYRTFLYCSEAKTVTHMINFDNNGCAYCNGVLAGQGGYNASGNTCVFNLVKGWNCIELANVDGDTGGKLSYVSSGSDGLFSNKTSHPEILYMTAELPIEMANNKVAYFSRANCFVDEVVFLNKTITQEEVKTYVGSGKRLTDPATVIDVPEPTNVTFSFS